MNQNVTMANWDQLKLSGHISTFVIKFYIFWLGMKIKIFTSNDRECNIFTNTNF